MITVKELISKSDKKKVCDSYISLCSDIPDDKRDMVIDKLSGFIDELLTIEPNISEDSIIIPYTCYDNIENIQYPDTSVYSIREIKKFFTILPYFEELNSSDIKEYNCKDIKQLWDKHCKTLESKRICLKL